MSNGSIQSLIIMCIIIILLSTIVLLNVISVLLLIISSILYYSVLTKKYMYEHFNVVVTQHVEHFRYNTGQLHYRAASYVILLIVFLYVKSNKTFKINVAR